MATSRAPLELTLRSIVLGGAITLLFTAANVYLGLKVGLTFATSIPAAVISMAILRAFKSATILENNIVQTVASAAGTLAAIIFVLPGLVMVGWWHGFPYWQTAGITMTGGLLGVMFSVPLRRALVVDSPHLPYPEGRAAAEVLRVGSESREGAEESARGLGILVWNSLASAGFAILTQTKVVLDTASLWFRAGAGATGISGGLSYALVGVGHLVGISVGMAMALGMVLGWWVLLPILTAHHPLPGGPEAWAGAIFSKDVRFFGAGVIGVAAIWTLLRIAGPVLGGIRSAMAASRARRGGETLAIEERDIPIALVALGSLALLAPIGWLLWDVLSTGPLVGSAPLLIGGALVFVVVIGLMIAAVTGYMAGLIGASNSPVSGIGILSVIASSLMLVGLFGRDHPAGTTSALVAYALIVTGVVFGVATISNDNLQDLKTGQLVGATPWKQQVALLFGVVFGSLVIPPVLDLLNTAFGFAGMPGAGSNALAAPQAALISALAKGVLGGRSQLDDDRLWRRRRRRAGDPRRAARQGQAAAAAAARGRHRHLSADGGDPADGDRIGDRLVLRSLGRSHRRSRLRAADGHAHRDRADRRREPVGRRLRRDRRGKRERCAPGAGGARLRPDRADRRNNPVLRRDRAALPQHQARRHICASSDLIGTNANATELSATP